ncbi:unnamed protein product [Trichobilharzia regenti]|nr:unnamed protein product [Trichobilharzia regenti]
MVFNSSHYCSTPFFYGTLSASWSLSSVSTATEKNPSILQEKFIQWDKDPPSGKIYSPGYPEVYPPNQIKDYVFVAPQSGKVRITVQTLQLDADKAIK